VATTPAVREHPKGLLYRPALLTPAEHDELSALVSAMTYDEVVMRGQAAKRGVVHLGFLYGYESWELRPGPEIPPELYWLRDRCGDLAAVPGEAFDEALVTRYPPGAGIGWHRDAPMFGSEVVGVSLVSESKMRFQRKVGGVRYTYDLTLEPGSAYVLAGPARWAWQHSIPAVKSLRYSITFRTVKDPGRWRAEGVQRLGG